jgi:hypothetical protein
MKIVIRVELTTDWGYANTIEAGRIDRPSQTCDPESVGLSLADGKQLLHNLQQAVIPAGFSANGNLAVAWRHLSSCWRSI